MAPTTEIAWADKILVDSSYFGGTAAQFSSTSANYAADAIADKIQWRLDPDGFAALQKVREEQRKADEAARRAQPQQAVQPQAVPKLF